MKKSLLYRIAKRAAFALFLVSTLALSIEAYANREDLSYHATPASFTTTTPASPSATVMLPDFTSIVAKQGPAVVNISVSEHVKTGFSGIPGFGFGPPDPNNPFYQFFHQFAPPSGNVTEHVLGSGFIISKNGIILTNAHVVNNADRVIVKLTDKREFKARVIGADKQTDVAVLKIDAHNLPTVKIGDSRSVKVGEWVLAIGSPFGFDNSVTAGIVSAKSRSLPDSGYVQFLQTDVAVNPGNSGGPLIDTSGDVIGINSQIYTRSGGYQGLSFAIPIDLAMNIEKQLLAHGKAEHGYLGVTIQGVNQKLAQTFGLNRPEGALISSVRPGSPAEKAGLKAGDIILKFNGQAISSSSDLPPLVAGLQPGTRVTMQVWRNDENRDVTMHLGNLGGAELADNGSAPSSKGKSMLGMEVRPLTPDERRQADTRGLLVLGVNNNGAAARAGIAPGDIVIAVNGQSVSSASKLRSLLARHKHHAALLIDRNGQHIYVPVDVG